MAATHLLPYDPVKKKRSDHAGDKRGAANISDMTGEETDKRFIFSIKERHRLYGS
jgi:hypothetical protein